MAKKRAKYDVLRVTFPPAERVTPLHEQYIADAEVQATTRASPVRAIRVAEYEPAAEETPADAGTEPLGVAATDEGPATSEACAHG